MPELPTGCMFTDPERAAWPKGPPSAHKGGARRPTWSVRNSSTPTGLADGLGPRSVLRCGVNRDRCAPGSCGGSQWVPRSRAWRDSARNRMRASAGISSECCMGRTADAERWVVRGFDPVRRRTADCEGEVSRWQSSGWPKHACGQSGAQRRHWWRVGLNRRRLRLVGPTRWRPMHRLQTPHLQTRHRPTQHRRTRSLPTWCRTSDRMCHPQTRTPRMRLNPMRGRAMSPTPPTHVCGSSAATWGLASPTSVSRARV